MNIIYTRLAALYKADQQDYQLTITCSNIPTACTKEPTLAHVNDDEKTLNFCDRFFEDAKTTDAAVADCQSPAPQMMKTLVDFRLTNSHVLAHEGTHTSFVMGARAKARDYAYGVKRCIALAKGVYSRATARYQKKKPMCPDPSNPTKEGLCHPDLAVTNADSISLFSTALYYSARCGGPVALPPPPPESEAPVQSESDDDSDDSDYVPSSGESSDESMSDGDDSDSA
ncbi:hypothetical protein DFH06DRAFT_1320943 [Mycena polygramma]|nr:hypothetical protein DFH06DRAFT_1320943 [Mycena polygramma]